MTKRIFDVAATALAFSVLGPVMVVVGLLVASKLGRPIFYKEQRPGLGGRPFTIRKFRTMTSVRSRDGKLLPDEQRLMRFGRILRATSLDELPELWNVLVGDMSLVGPRPLLTEYLPLYSPQQARRHEVRPGLTGWAQVNGRNALSWEEKFDLDVWYVDNQSIWLDIKIIGMTLIKVVKRDGITAEGEVTMPRFTGSVSD